MCVCVCVCVLVQTPIISLVSTQSKLLQHEIYLTDRIDNPSRRQGGGGGAYPPTTTGGGGGERLPHLNCIVLLRPTEESIEACERELEQGRYGGYWLCEYKSYLFTVYLPPGKC